MDQILLEIDRLPKKAPAQPAIEVDTLKEIALGSFCWHHNGELYMANAVREWQRALTAARATLVIIERLKSLGIKDVDDTEDDSSDSDISSMGGDNSEESDDDHSPNGDDTTSSTISIGSDSNPEPNESLETKSLREELARVTPEVEALRAQIERTTPELDELRQQLARAIPEAEVEDLRRQLERATLEREEVKLDKNRFSHENKRLRRKLDEVRRITVGLDAGDEVEERQSEPLNAQSEQSEESDMRSEEAESSSGASPGGGEGES
jgi:hypothetical protein